MNGRWSPKPNRQRNLNLNRNQQPQSAAAAVRPNAAEMVANIIRLPERGQSPMLGELISAHGQSAHGLSAHGLGEAFAAGLLGVGVIETLERIRAAHELSSGAYGRFLRTLESQDCPPGAAPLRLDEMAQWLTGLIAALTKPSNEDSDTRRLKSEAAKALAAGDLEASVQQPETGPAILARGTPPDRGAPARGHRACSINRWRAKPASSPGKPRWS